MAPSCPISSNRVDTKVVRGISLQVVLISLLLLITQNPIFAFVLFYDFAVRIARLQNFSPFYRVARFVTTKFGLTPVWSDDAPKQFARYLGLGISFVMFVLYMGDFLFAAFIVTGILILCALIEALFDFCIGCKIYFLLRRFF